MEEITKVQRNYHGDIISFQTSSGRIISYRKAVLEASEGILHGVSLNENEWGETELTNSGLEGGFQDYPTIF
ncbi:DUF3892 domain-containing protein [Bacillus sp. KH172YL63]|uniref:DUF3892 domain-containing protein n=1 Tax=Bacillus sp. KH172YL63 TaxID=2709784 RepID=UPI0013E4A11B|nr:DUF3892 domain-containing protein [Bacillus sp. KH172YL63]BCB04452.1 hypothetical protein KH172YL63_25850 [Bacillus sp. KH172YL63]